MDDIQKLIESMEASKGTRSSKDAANYNTFNFEAINLIIKKLGGSLIVVPQSSPDQVELQDALNVMTYINALIVKRLDGAVIE